MKKLICLWCLAFCAGCVAPNYLYTFDLTDPGARNFNKPGQRDVLEDADVRAEILGDPVNFRAIAYEITNKTDQPLVVNWNGLLMIGPDGSEANIRPASAVGTVEPGAKVFATLMPFVLPAEGAAAQAYDNSIFQLTVPMVVRGTPREYRYHLKVALQRL